MNTLPQTSDATAILQTTQVSIDPMDKPLQASYQKRYAEPLEKK